MNLTVTERWAKRLERLLASAPADIEVLVTRDTSLVCTRGTHAKAMDAVGVEGENNAIEAGMIAVISSRLLKPYGESL